MQESYIEISLWITSQTLTVDEISKYVHLNPSYTQNLGDRAGRTTRRYEEHSWNLGQQLIVKDCAEMSRDAEHFLTTFLDSLKDSAPQVKELSRSCYVLIQILFSSVEMPYIGLTAAQVAAVERLGAHLSFDVVLH